MRPGPAADHDPRRRTAHRRGDPRPARAGHAALPRPSPHRRLGGDLPRQRGIRGQAQHGKTRKGDSWLRTALIEAANSAAARTRDTYLNAQYVRIKCRRGHSKAIVAVAHSILVAAYYILRNAKPYEDLGGDYFLRRETPERLTRRLVRQLERLGQSVTLEPAPEAR